MEETNKEKTLAAALAKAEALSAQNEKLIQSQTQLTQALQSAQESLASCKGELEQLQAKHRDIDQEVSLKAAEIAAHSGAAPLPAAVSQKGAATMEELAEQLDKADGTGKARIMETNAERIIRHLRGVV